MTRAHDLHAPRLGNATLVIFHLERKHLPLHSTYDVSPYGGKFELGSPYRIGSSKGGNGWLAWRSFRLHVRQVMDRE